MKFDELAKARRSIRSYQDKDVHYDVIGEILETAVQAPSADNVQNWCFIIVKDQERRNKIAKYCYDQTWMSEAPAHIVLSYDDRNIKTLFPKHSVEFSIQNIAALADHILLKATELDLGTCWVGIKDKTKLAALLKLPDYLAPLMVITIGYTKGKPRKPPRNQPHITMFFEEWGFKAKRRKDVETFPLSKHPQRLRDKIAKSLKRTKKKK